MRDVPITWSVPSEFAGQAAAAAASRRRAPRGKLLLHQLGDPREIPHDSRPEQVGVDPMVLVHHKIPVSSNLRPDLFRETLRVSRSELFGEVACPIAQRLTGEGNREVRAKRFVTPITQDLRIHEHLREV